MITRRSACLGRVYPGIARRSVTVTVIAAAVAAVAMACGGAVATEPGNGESGPRSSGPSGGAATGGGSSGAGSVSRTGSDAPTAAPVCCPPDTTRSGGMLLGGASKGMACSRTYDFWCSTNWRIEKDASGCPAWVYDVRAPAAGEDDYCLPAKVCTPGNYAFCRCASGVDGTKRCQADGTYEACVCE